MTKQTETIIKIRYWGEDAHHDPEIHDTWLDREMARVTTMIEEGNNQGDLVGPEGERGWWEIDTKHTDSEAPQPASAKSLPGIYPGLSFNDIAWEPKGTAEGDPQSVLCAAIQIGSFRLHLRAVAVVEGEDGIWMAVDKAYESDLEAVEQMNGAKSETFESDGRQYVMWALPFGR
jgi:hypothetical protein